MPYAVSGQHYAVTGGTLTIKYMDIDDLMKFLKKKHKDRKVLKTFPMRQEWAKIWGEVEMIRKEGKKLEQLLDHKRKAFWALVEGDLKEYRSLKVSDDCKSVELYEDQDDE